MALLGFVPMELTTETRAEVQKPLATVVIGGFLTTANRFGIVTLLSTPIAKMVPRTGARGTAFGRGQQREWSIKPNRSALFAKRHALIDAADLETQRDRTVLESDRTFHFKGPSKMLPAIVFYRVSFELDVVGVSYVT